MFPSVLSLKFFPTFDNVLDFVNGYKSKFVLPSVNIWFLIVKN